MSHPLHQHPLCAAEDLGLPIPASPHAVSVCLPTWRDVVGYEEKDARVHGKMRTGYPRFFLHPRVEEVLSSLRRRLAGPGEDCLPFPGRLSAEECAAFVRSRAAADARVEDAGGGLHATIFPAAAAGAAREYWQHAGRILSSRAAEWWLANGSLALDDETARRTAGAEKALRDRLAAWSGAPAGDFSLHPSGMAAIFRAWQLATARAPGRRTAMFGFPYIDTLKIQEKFGAGVAFFCRGDEADLAALERVLDAEPLAAIFCEVPSNPLLHVADLPALAALARRHGIPLVVDDTIGTFHNIDVLPYADLVATSLTKAVSGEGDVMAGSLLVSPHSPAAAEWRNLLETPRDDFLFGPDVLVLERNARDFPARMERTNAGALRLAEFLAAHPAVERVYYPGLGRPEAYRRLMKPGGGWGGLLSFLPRNAEHTAPLLYERIRISRGISLGTTYTLICPYVQLAHYRELDWARSCGIDPFLLRVPVGTEPPDLLIERFTEALNTLQDP